MFPIQQQAEFRLPGIFPLQLLHIFSGADLVLIGESPVEIGIIAEAAELAHLRGGGTGGHHLPGHDQPLLDDIPVDGGAHHPAELPGQVILAEEELIGQQIQAQILAVMVIDVAQHPVHHRIGVLPGFRSPARPEGCPVHQHQQLCQQAQTVQLRGKFLGILLPDQLLEQIGQQLPGDAVGPDQICVGGLAGIEALAQILVRQDILLQKAAAEPQHVPLVVLLFRGEHRLVQFLGVDQQHITGAEPVAAGFNIIADISGNEEIDLVKIMVVQGYLLATFIPVVVGFEGIAAHFLPHRKAVGLVGHGKISSSRTA